MNLTCLTGNGFDIGLGPKTDYRSFLDWYLYEPNESPEVEWLKEQVLKDTELWSDAELAFGALKFSEFDGQPFETYDRCLESFSNALSRYLAIEGARWWNALYSCFKARNIPLVVCPYVKDFPDRGYSASYRAKMYEQEKCRVFASLFDQNKGLREAIEAVDPPRITVLHPKKVPDGLGRINPCDFLKLKYFYQKFVKKEN